MHRHSAVLPAATTILLFAATGANAITFNNQHVNGDHAVVINSCGQHEVKDNYIDGTLSVLFVGNTLPCGVDILVSGNTVLNNLEIRAQNNIIDNGNLRVRGIANPQVGGTMVMRVESNVIHRKPASPGQSFNLIIDMDANGRNNTNMSNNEVVGQNLEAHINSNWVKNDLSINLNDNVNASDLLAKINGNIVNNLIARLARNRSCNEADIDFISNTIDTHFLPSIVGNRSCKSFGVNISLNKVPYIPPRLLDPTVSDNHSATGQLTLRFDLNTADTIDLRFENNGAGLGGAIDINNNSAALKSEFRVNGNQTEKPLAIQIQNNSQPPGPYEVMNNLACSGSPLLNVQPAPVQTGTMQGCTRQMGADSDGDGLTDDYEKMIGTDFQGIDAWDTDFDGLADGWADYNKNGSWDPGEAMGELGDPNNPHVAGSPNIGSVESLFGPTNKTPNLFCKDVYVEADFMSADPGIANDVDHTLSAAAISPYAASLRRHGIFLYVDTGWSAGFAASDAPGGGEKVIHVRKLDYYSKNRFDYFNFKNGEINKDYDSSGMLEPRHFSNSRKGSFHYLLVGHTFKGGKAVDRSVGFAEPLGFKEKGKVVDTEGDDLFIADDPIRAVTVSPYNIAMAYTLCHELGHNFGLGLTRALHEKASSDYWSCMSYHDDVKFKVFDYSDGRMQGGKDNDDWSALKVRTSISTWGQPLNIRDPSK